MLERLLLSMLIALGVALAAVPARAESKTVAIYIEGPDADARRAEVVQSVPAGIAVTDPTRFAMAMVAAGQNGAFGDSMRNSKKRRVALGVMRAAMATAHADALIVGHLRKTKKGTNLWLVLFDALEVDPRIDVTITLTPGQEGRELQGLLRGSLYSLAEQDASLILSGEEALPSTSSTTQPSPSLPPRSSIAAKASAPQPATRPSSPPAPRSNRVVAPPATTWLPSAPPPPSPSAAMSSGPTVEQDVAQPPEPPLMKRARSQVPTELVEVGIGFDLGARQFNYSSPMPERLSRMRSYHLMGIPAFAIDGAVYPFANQSTPIARDIGLTFDFAHAVGIESAMPDGSNSVGTSSDRGSVGLRGRIRTGGPRAPLIGIGAAFDYRRFAFDSTPALDGSLPGVEYKSIRVGVDGRMPIGPVAVTIGANYLAPFAAGDVYDRFGDASVNGVVARAGVSASVAGGIEARLVASYTRFFSSFKPAPGDTYVAGGALDEYQSVSIGAAYVY